MLTQILKVLYLIIGLAMLFMIGRDLIRRFTGEQYEDYYAEDIYVGSRLEESLREGKIPQGILYGSPESIPNSDYKMIPLSVMTYQQAKEIEYLRNQAGDIASSYGNHINIIFLDENYAVIRPLLDSLGAISNLKLPYEYGEVPDTTIQNILYLIGFRDTNQDNLLNSEDEKDLFISDLDGGNLLQITKGFNIEDFSFTEQNSKVFIQYTLRTNQLEEHRSKMFALYDIRERKLRMLTGITEEIKAVESMLIKAGQGK